jgi:hypothetical protein
MTQQGLKADLVGLQRPSFKRPKAKEKIKLLTKILNDYISQVEDLKAENEIIRTRPAKREKKDPTPGQKKVQDSFGQRAKIASQLYREEGATLTWAEAMSLAGPLLDMQSQKGKEKVEADVAQ